MTPPRASSALPPRALSEAVPKGISGRASYLQVCLVFRSYPQVITTFFNRLLFGPPQGFTPASSCPWIDHLGFGSAPRDLNALFRLAFAPAPRLQTLSLAAQDNSQAHSTKGTPPPLRAAASCRSMVSGSISLPSPGFFSPFPHGTCTLSVAAGVQPWIVVDPDSDRVPRAPPYSGYRGRPGPPDTRLSRSPAPLPSGFSSGPVF